MEIRPLEPHELPALGNLYKNAYRITTDTWYGWQQGIELANTRAVVGQGRVLSLIQILPFEMEIGGRVMSMGGIGGVATWADQQGKGLAGRLMSYSVGEMRRLGHVISALFPFSFRYYGKFGWEMGGRRWIYRNIAPRELPRRKEADRVRAVVHEEDFELLKGVYERGTGLYNGMMRRSPKRWERTKNLMGADRVHLYLIEAEQAGAPPLGYFVCEDQLPAGAYKHETTVREFVCLNDAAYRSMFGFLASLPPNVGKLAINAPEWPCLWPYFQEPFVETAASGAFMIRVVDVPAACRARGWAAQAHGAVDFALSDAHGPWNEGTWHLEVANGQASIEPSQRPAQISLTIQQFSGVFIGFQDPTSWVRQGVLGPGEAKGAQALKELFCDKPSNLLDGF